MGNYLQVGDVVTIPAPAAVSSGDGVLVGTLFVVAATDAESGAEWLLKLLACSPCQTSAQAWTVGALIYWDGGVAATADGSGANTLIGKALAGAANPSSTGVVRLDG